MTPEELKIYLDEKYPDLHLRVIQERGKPVSCALGEVGFNCYIGFEESINQFEPRLLSALEDVKVLVEHDIAKIKGTQT